ncbi:MAG TPA: bifunctional diaminohydroxyphosphoribosylaminopyrimidine deaminase/5-amino-6-(5-phosphoribosylamino)uracil reductase RibD, partial [Rickettsiales bacterium]|nr:bifunctional diaminohydroxyphosphoribosylaminopyrimidine deaminase/5-amino-6-(5-phosphoribosylamino)uracil reductase RibD [Rickettsiales bacterium]
MDKKFLSNAINLAKKNNGITAPNPSVGCVIVKNNEIIATGITGKEGSPHAEYAAINSVKDKNLLKGSSIYVSLEPCCHFGKNPPCIDIIVKNKIARVIIATIDKNPKISGKSIEILQKNGIEVKILSQNDTDEFYEPFFKAVTKKIPYISLKFGVSLDGKIATKDFDSKWITSQESRLYTHHLRSINDAILIGSGTLKKDNPLLDCRILGLENYSPKRFVIANNLDFDENLQLFQSALKFPVYILLNKNFRGNISAFEKFGVKIILCEEKNGDVDLQ